MNDPKVDVNGEYEGSMYDNREDVTALTAAIRFDRYETVDLLMSHPDIDVNIAFMDEIRNLEHEDEFALTRLVAHPKFDINMKNKDGKTALMLAVLPNNVQIYNRNIDKEERRV